MRSIACILVAILSNYAADAYVPKTPSPCKPLSELQKATTGILAAAAIASAVVSSDPLPADAASAMSPYMSSTQTVAAKVVREGIYGEFEYDLPEQKYDDARSTYKAAKETKSNKGKYTAILAILIVGSFIVPMAQYFWYVRDDDTTEKFFSSKTNQKAPEPPQKKKWF
ncbi:hypothetical protein MPSEU_000281900 [Mayamaea pseudoterrestris]|nr:hypothetical protein MPSEU_000281900 [Mayamaea pseudoterrestris]